MTAKASQSAPEDPDAQDTGGATKAHAALAVKRAPALAEGLLAQSGVPGMAVAIVYDDALAFAGGFGVREVGKGDRVDADTVFQLASVSKSLAATVVSAVVGKGTVAWESRMADVHPGFALRDAWPTQNVSLADLFAHRSGLPDHVGDVLEDLGFGRDEVLHRLRYLEPEYSFREGYAYTNFGLTAAACAVAEAVGMSWEDLSRDRLCAPLGMTRTSSRFADYMAQPNRAIPHVQEGDAWVVTPMQRDPDPQSPAGGASSTARDVAHWLRLMLGNGVYEGNELIPAAALAPMQRPQAVSRLPANPMRDRAGFYGLGMNVGYTDVGAVQWGHSGAFALGAATAFYMLPASGFGVVALTNGAPSGVPEAFCLSVLELATTGDVTRDWLALVGPMVAATEPTYGAGTDWASPPADATPPLPDAAYAGTYRNDYYGDAEIAAVTEGLVLRIGPRALEFPLKHYSRDTFSWQPIGENALGRSGLSFLIGPDGRASAFRDEYLDTDGAGALTRSS